MMGISPYSFFSESNTIVVLLQGNSAVAVSACDAIERDNIAVR
jgi:hypothetical protein